MKTAATFPRKTSRRLSCDCSIVHWHENAQGDPLNIGRKTRSIPPAIRRALKRRDHGCRFPGCTCKRFVDAHHVKHWADGGETSMGNLVLLCRIHHRLVHEAGYGVEMKSGREAVFSMPDGKVIPQGPDGRGPDQPLDRDTPAAQAGFSTCSPSHLLSPPSRGNVFEITLRNREKGLEITADTAVTQWHGERMDNFVAVDMLLQCE